MDKEEGNYKRQLRELMEKNSVLLPDEEEWQKLQLEIDRAGEWAQQVWDKLAEEDRNIRSALAQVPLPQNFQERLLEIPAQRERASFLRWRMAAAAAVLLIIGGLSSIPFLRQSDPPQKVEEKPKLQLAQEIDSQMLFTIKQAAQTGDFSPVAHCQQTRETFKNIIVLNEGLCPKKRKWIISVLQEEPELVSLSRCPVTRDEIDRAMDTCIAKLEIPRK